MKRTPEDRIIRSQRVTAGTLLLAERQTLRDLRRDVHASIDTAIAEAHRRRDAGPVRKAAALAALAYTAKLMASNAYRALWKGRQNARQLGASRLHTEMVALGVPVGAGLLQGHQGRAQDDVHHAQVASESLSAQWLGLATIAVVRALRRDEDHVDAIESTIQPMVSRLARTATTETAVAFNDERREALADAIEADEALASAVEAASLVRLWDAILDSRTCAECRAHDGETAPIGSSFSGGDEPGEIHARCRCIASVVPATWAALAA